MKKLSLFTVISFLLLGTGLKAQNLYFCDNFTDAGEPMGITNSKVFDSRGGYVYFLYDNGKKNIKSKVLLISIAVQKNNDYSSYDTKVFDNVNHDKNWAVYDYNFTEPGNYRVSILDGEKKELAKGFITVTFKEEKQTDNQDYVNKDQDQDQDQDNGDNQETYDPVDNNYYNAKMTFTTDVQDGKPVDDYETFTIQPAGGAIYIYVMNDKPLKSAGINLIIKRMSEETYSYDEEITNEPYTINGKIPGTFLQYTFTKAGKYEVRITNKDDVLIAKGFVTIEMQE
jgi:hypothetical protein